MAEINGSDLAARTREKYNRITLALIERDIRITAMESCTAGLISSLLTDTEGSSAVFRGSFVVYSNEAKIASGVPAAVIEKYGVYSRETAVEMARAAKAAFGAGISVGVTGTMGNADPGNADSVPGICWIAAAFDGDVVTRRLTIEPQESRLAYKLIVADAVADIILGRLFPARPA